MLESDFRVSCWMDGRFLCFSFEDFRRRSWRFCSFFILFVVVVRVYLISL